MKVFRVKGRVTLENSYRLKELLQTTMEGGENNIVVNLTSVEYMDSSGIGAIAFGATKLRQASGHLIVCGAQGSVKQIFDLVKIGSLVKMFDTEEEGIKFIHQVLAEKESAENRTPENEKAAGVTTAP